MHAKMSENHIFTMYCSVQLLMEQKEDGRTYVRLFLLWVDLKFLRTVSYHVGYSYSV